MTITMRFCKRCKQDKLPSDFRRNRRIKLMADGNDQEKWEYVSVCRKCEREKDLARHRPKVPRTDKVSDEDMKRIKYDAEVTLSHLYLTKKDVERITQKAKWPFKGGKKPNDD